MITLQIFVDEMCWSCAESYRIVQALQPSFPTVRFEFSDLRREPHPDNVFAAPTFLLNGRVISLGNPTPRRLRQMLEEAIAS